jgi:hypothetical protein
MNLKLYKTINNQFGIDIWYWQSKRDIYNDKSIDMFWSQQAKFKFEH